MNPSITLPLFDQSGMPAEVSESVSLQYLESFSRKLNSLRWN